jgi:hypothetical protein
MSRHISPSAFYNLPSGAKVHPSRLIHKDGSLMWKHALLYQNALTSIPLEQAHESHIIKTALRIEELNSWVSQGLDPWDCLMPVRWYDPSDYEFSTGISVLFKHTTLSSHTIFETLKNHKQEHETLTCYNDLFFFKRC